MSLMFNHRPPISWLLLYSPLLGNRAHTSEPVRPRHLLVPLSPQMYSLLFFFNRGRRSKSHSCSLQNKEDGQRFPFFLIEGEGRSHIAVVCRIRRMGNVSHLLRARVVTSKNLAQIQSSQLAFYVNLYRAVIGPSATLTGR